MEKDNPAERLVVILEEARSYNKQSKCADAWRTILCGEGSAPLYVVTARYGKTAALVQEVVETCERHFPKQADSSATWANPVSRAFSEIQFGQSITEFNRLIPDHVLTQLHTLSALFDTYSKFGTVSEDQLIEFRAGISTLLDDVLNSDLSKEVKEYLARSLHSILTALNEYRISGTLPVLRTIESVYGHAFHNEEYRKALSEHPTGKKAVGYLHDVASAMTIATAGIDLTLTAPAIFQQALSHLSKVSGN